VKSVTNTLRRPAISLDTIRRMSLCLRMLVRLRGQGVETVSSADLAAAMNFSAEQLRKDFSCFGRFGKTGVGYNVEQLATAIRAILGTDRVWNVAVIGAGRLGAALTGYRGFWDFNLRIRAAFDSDPAKAGRRINGIRVYPAGELPAVARRENITVAILAVGETSARQAAELAAKSGIRAILNFAPVSLKLPAGVHVSDMDMSCELETLVYRINKETA